MKTTFRTLQIGAASALALAGAACSQRANECVDVTTITPGFTGAATNAAGDDTVGTLDINGQKIDITFVDTTRNEAGGLLAQYTTRPNADMPFAVYTGANDLVGSLELPANQGRDLTIALDTYLNDINAGFEAGYANGVQNVATATDTLNGELDAIETNYPEQSITQQVCAVPEPERATTASYDGSNYYVTGDGQEQQNKGELPWLAVVATLGGLLAFLAYKKKQNFTYVGEANIARDKKEGAKTDSVVILRNENVKDPAKKGAFWILTQENTADPAKTARKPVRLYSTDETGHRVVLDQEKGYAAHPKMLHRVGQRLAKKGGAINDTVVREGPVRRALEAVEVPEGAADAGRVLAAAVKQLRL